jgi:hypothetical protein
VRDLLDNQCDELQAAVAARVLDAVCEGKRANVALPRATPSETPVSVPGLRVQGVSPAPVPVSLVGLLRLLETRLTAQFCAVSLGLPLLVFQTNVKQRAVWS